MKKNYFDRALKMFDTFKSHKLSEDDFVQADAKAAKLNDKASDFRVILQMAKDTISGNYKMSAWNLSVIIGTIVYVISPIDAIPDLIPVLGWLDDITIVGYALSKLSEEIKKYKEYNNI